MNSAFAQLLLKELRLQRGNLIFAACAFVLIFIGLWIIRLNPGVFLGYSTEDVQSTVMFLMGIPVLIVILPTMFGSTAAAAEKPLDVLAWQSALPVARWKVILAKCLVAAASVVVVAGVFPYILEVALEESDFLQQLTRGFWIGLHGLLFCAIGFFAGSHSKDDYQGLMVAVVPTVVVLVSLMLFDIVGKVIPAGLPFELTRPWAVVVRLLAMMALLVVLAVPMHIRVPVRRWWPMAGRLAVVFAAGLVLTAWNLHVEGTVLKKLAGEGETAESVTIDAAGRKVVEPVLIGRVKRGGINLYTNFQPGARALQSGRHVIPLAVPLSRADRNELGAYGFVLVRSDGTLAEFPQGILGQLAGVSKDQDWVLLESDEVSFLNGPLGISIPLFVLPDSVAGLILRAVGIDYFTGGHEVKLPVNHPGPSPGDIALVPGQERGRIWKDGAGHVPAGWRTMLTSFSIGSAMGINIQKRGETTMTAVLTQTAARGEYELAGFVHGYAAYVSDDGLWVRDFSTTPSSFRKTLPWDEARALPPLDSRAAYGSEIYWRRSAATTTTLANGQTLVTRGVGFLPFTDIVSVVDTDEGPATVEVYKLYETAPAGSSEKLRALEVGVLLRNLTNGTTTPLTLLTAEEATRGELQDLVISNSWMEWNQNFQTLVARFGSHVRILDLSNYRSSTPEEVQRGIVIVSERASNSTLLSPNRLVSVEHDSIYLSEW